MALPGDPQWLGPRVPDALPRTGMCCNTLAAEQIRTMALQPGALLAIQVGIPKAGIIDMVHADAHDAFQPPLGERRKGTIQDRGLRDKRACGDR